MTALLLLTLSTALGAPGPADDYLVPDLILPSTAIGQVPRLAVPPADLPDVVDQVGGLWVPYPRNHYLAGQLSALYRYPTLAQTAADDGAKSERDACALKIMDIQAAQPTWLDRWRTHLVWGLVGAVIGGIAGAWAAR